MEKIRITKLHGVYYKLSDCFGEIEFSKDYNYVKRIYDSYISDNELNDNAEYIGLDLNLILEKEIYDNGRFIDSEVLLNYDISNI